MVPRRRADSPPHALLRMSQPLNDMIPDIIVDDLFNAVGTDNHAHDQAPATFDGFGSQESLQDISSQEFRDAGFTSQDFRDIAQAMPSEDVPPSTYGLGISDLALPGVGQVPVSEPSPSNRMMPWGDLSLMIVDHGVHKRIDCPKTGSIECAAHLNMHPPACVGAVVLIGNKPPPTPLHECTGTSCISRTSLPARRALTLSPPALGTS